MARAKMRSGGKRAVSRSVSSVRRKKIAKVSYAAPAIKTSRRVTSRLGQGTQITVRMPYATKVSMPAATLGAASAYQFRLNSIFDPDYTGVGHQPGGHDQYAQIYETYCVTGVSFNISFANDNDAPNIVGYYISDREDVSSDAVVMVEQGINEWKHIAGQDGGPANASFSGYVDLPKLMGYSYNDYVTNPNYQTVFGVNPADVGYITLWGTNIASGSLGNVYAFVELVYTVRLQGTRLVPQS